MNTKFDKRARGDLLRLQSARNRKMDEVLSVFKAHSTFKQDAAPAENSKIESKGLINEEEIV